jgi:hypothetical protein
MKMKNKLLILAMGIILSAQTLVAQVPPYVPTNGLVGYWPFSGNANDASGNVNNGTVNGATLTSDRNGNANSAYQFDGASNNIGLNNAFMGGNQVESFSFYTRLKTSGNAVSGSAYNIWGKSFNWGEINFGIDSNNTVYIVWANSNNGNTYTHIQTTDGIAPNTWYDIVITYQSSEVKIFFNGINQTSNDYYGTNSLANFAQDSNSNKIGSRIFSGQTVQFFNGIIDDFGVWNRALSQAEITNMYNGVTYSDTCNAVSGSLTQGLVGYWPFCGNANDDSGNGNNGTVNGATLTTDRFGNSNSAYNFSQSGQYIDIGNNPSLNHQNSTFTMSAWINISEYSNFSYNNAIISNRSMDNKGSVFGIVGTINSNDYGKLQFGCGGGGGNYQSVISTNVIPTNEWVNVMLTYSYLGNDNNLVKLYINGVLNAIGTLINTPGPILENNSIGDEPLDPANQNFTGKIDDIGIWNRALTQQEITNLFNANQCITNITVTDTLIINVGQLSYNNPITYANNITIAPNPASTQININFNNITDLNGGTLKVINSLGQEVATTPITTSGTQSIMQLATWGGSGMYFVQIINPQGQIVDIKKIILQ